MRTLLYFTPFLACLLLAGCGMVPITDDQITEISQKMAAAAESGAKLAKPILDPIVPGLTNIVAVFVGLLSGAGTKWGLKALQQKRREGLKALVREAGH
jgi:hypothetical protein